MSARVAEAPSIAEIRELAAQALEESRHNALTIAEIRQLTDVAVSRAQKVEAYAARLAELAQGVGGD